MVNNSIFFILFIFLLLISVVFIIIDNKIAHKGGGLIDSSIIEESKSLTNQIEDGVKKLINIQKFNKLNEFNEFNELNESPQWISETQKINQFIANNDVTKFVTRKGNKVYSFVDFLKLLKGGNLPQGIIYTTTKNKYIYV